MKKQFYLFGVQAFIFCWVLIGAVACKQDTTANKQPAVSEKKENKPIQKPSGTYKRYDATHRPYSILLPDGWKLKEHYKSGTLKVTSLLPAKGEDPFKQYVLMTPMPASAKLNPKSKKMEPMPINLDEFLQRHLRTLKSKYPDALMLKEERTSISGKEAAQIIYTHHNMEEPHVDITTISNIFVHDHQTYILSFIEASENFENCRPMFQEIFKSFKFN